MLSPMKTLMSIAFLLMVLQPSISRAQIGEPGNNLGKSLFVMRQQFPELHYVKSDDKGDLYQDGYTQDGIAVFFYFKDNKVIEECMICQTNDGFPRMWFDEMANSFSENYPFALKTNNVNTKCWRFSTFTIHLIYVSENGMNTALIIYEKGGYLSSI